ncbi:MAG TPA: redoxin domain-containing protein [Phenylobacterium sp.]|uniref:redoxin domain-containing protein n=1 Tax=Phenylobacterium sp. TaxID=1871053 RepID=UPI002C980F2D|nr:redoxin domain-containing protein [Phenylobacterium sp.]HSV03702.1 redoxin domain-containing protein [Phenylobacterium sp.]
MKAARLGLLAALGGAALVYGLASDGLSTHGARSIAAEAAAAQPTTVGNFMLVDENLNAHELYRMADKPAIVLITQMDGCPISRSQAPAYKELEQAFAGKGVQFLMLNSATQDNREAIQQEAKDAGFDMPILLDQNQLVGEALGVKRTAEVIVINPKTWQVVYHGPVDDRSDYGGGQKPVEHRYAADAIDAVLAGKPVQQASLPAKGCLIDFPARAQAQNITYVHDVAPILEKNCVGCHEKGGIGPFAMDSYDRVKGFSPMIREVLMTHRMPPYNADPHVGKFSDNKNLTPQELKTIVHWVEAGAPRGEGADPLAAHQHVAQDWPLGKPDLVLDVPAFTIPATGVVDYKHPWVQNPLTEGRWIRATTIKVEQRQGVHHLLTGYMKDVPKPGEPAYENRWGVSVGGYAVGAESEISPPDVGSYLPPGGAIGIQAHYTPFGKEATDHSKIGVYFYKPGETPKYVMHGGVVVDNTITIPPNEPRHHEIAYLTFPHDALLYSAFPHAHYRGYAADLWIRYPDGKEKLLISLPRYDFNWQRDYTFAEPLKVPAGSKLIAHWIYDNSKENPANPDPTKTITWGEQSWQEMFYTAIRYRWLDETSDHQLPKYDEDLNSKRMLGMLDDNVDGKLQKAELKGQMGDMLGKYFAVLDKDNDGTLSMAELTEAQKLMGNRRKAPSTSAEAFASAEKGSTK